MVFSISHGVSELKLKIMDSDSGSNDDFVGEATYVLVLSLALAFVNITCCCNSMCKSVAIVNPFQVSDFTCAMFKSPEEVLKRARHMAAVEISCEPCVRKHVRSIFMDNAMVSTTPTPDGNTNIDTFHQYAGVKWLRDKPLTRFDDAQWLLIEKAESEKLLQVTIKLPKDILEKLISDSNDYYLSNGVSKSAQLWNGQRKLILHDAIFKFLLPSMEKEGAENWLRMEYVKVLWEKVSVAPYQRKGIDASSEEESAPWVLAYCWGPRKPATTFVMLDSAGEVLDVLYTASLTSRSQNVDGQQRKKNDQ